MNVWITKGYFKHPTQPHCQVALNCVMLFLLVKKVDVQRKCVRSIRLVSCGFNLTCKATYQVEDILRGVSAYAVWEVVRKL